MSLCKCGGYCSSACGFELDRYKAIFELAKKLAEEASTLQFESCDYGPDLYRCMICDEAVIWDNNGMSKANLNLIHAKDCALALFNKAVAELEKS